METITRNGITIDGQTRINQIKASDPSGSAFVAANAGSGKTFVLAKRVTRLLLAGNRPSRILCLTFTKAAAAEMQSRVFSDLSKWALLDDNALNEVLGDVEGIKDYNPSSAIRNKARRLFAEALETPGGLRVLTIHAFCEGLLHQFPLEANIAGHFNVMDDQKRERLVSDARIAVIGAAQQNSDSPTGKTMQRLLARTSEFGFTKALDDLLAQKHAFREWIPFSQMLVPALAEQKDRFGFGEAETTVSCIEGAFPLTDLDSATMQRFAELASHSAKKTDQEQLGRIQKFVESKDPLEQFELLKDICLTKAGAPRKTVATQDVTKSFPDLADRHQRECLKLLAVQDRIATLNALEATADLARIGHQVLSKFETAKQAGGYLDFDDLVAKAADLLTKSDARNWVQYKLDLGIDHVLVDEAQDTSPPQWKVIRSLVNEYFSGEGIQRPNELPQARTVFAVGDEKQSIFSFQGARPDIFAEQKREIKNKAQNAGSPFEDLRLNTSFRSSLDVLWAVDAVFEDPANHNGLTEQPEPTKHDSARRNAPGEVEIWPMETPSPEDEPEDWTQPIDSISISAPEAKLANRIAATIATWVETGDMLRSRGREVRYDDILILVRSRGSIMRLISQSLKQHSVPVTGMDRLKLTDHIAVKDLMALGRFVLLSEDDLSLAALLKSPLIGLTEDELFKVANKRGNQSLFAAMGQRADTAKLKLAHETLTRWRKRADQVPVFEFYASILHGENGRAKLLSRLGSEAEDVIDSFLDLCVEREGEGVPGLDGFLAWLETSEPIIKREMDEGRGEVRIMTAHGSKGLEASVVFLVDPGSAPKAALHNSSIFKVPESAHGQPASLFWQPPKSGQISFTSDQKAKIEIADEQEYRRLLYVGMTRAADRLVMCGFQTSRPYANSWNMLAKQALVDASGPRGATPHVEEIRQDNEVLAWRWCLDPSQHSPEPEASTEKKTSVALPPLNPLLKQAAKAEPDTPEPVLPSQAYTLLEEASDALDGEQVDSHVESTLSPVLGDEKTSYALERGTIIHRLLEMLPDMITDNWDSAANAYLQTNAPKWTQPQRSSAQAQVLSILRNPDFAKAFNANSRAEVTIAGTLQTEQGPRPVSGKIDRLCIDDNSILIVDFKTNHVAPKTVEDCPESYITQMAVYAEILGQLYPEHTVETVLVWTSEPHWMVLPTALIENRIAQW